MKNPGQNRTLGIGLLIILIGLTFLLRQMNVFTPRVEGIIFTWQMLLILAGTFTLLFGDNKTTGFILLIVGGFFILPEIYSLPYNFRNTFWPLLLIFVGIFILFRSGRFFRKDPGDLQLDVEDTAYIDEVNIFSGAERKVSGKNFRGGKITSIFGGSELDLTGATLTSGNNVIEVFYLFGGSSITVPNDWVVINRVTAILGGFTDKRSGLQSPEENPGKVLIIQGMVLFGGGEIKTR